MPLFISVEGGLAQPHRHTDQAKLHYSGDKTSSSRNRILHAMPLATSGRMDGTGAADYVSE